MPLEKIGYPAFQTSQPVRGRTVPPHFGGMNANWGDSGLTHYGSGWTSLSSELNTLSVLFKEPIFPSDRTLGQLSIGSRRSDRKPAPILPAVPSSLAKESRQMRLHRTLPGNSAGMELGLPAVVSVSSVVRMTVRIRISVTTEADGDTRAAIIARRIVAAVVSGAVIPRSVIVVVIIRRLAIIDHCTSGPVIPIRAIVAVAVRPVVPYGSVYTPVARGTVPVSPISVPATITVACLGFTRGEESHTGYSHYSCKCCIKEFHGYVP